MASEGDLQCPELDALIRAHDALLKYTSRLESNFLFWSEDSRAARTRRLVNLLTQRVKEYLDTAQTPAVIDQFPLAGDCMGINTRTQLQSTLRSQRARLVKLSNRYKSRKEPQRGSSEPTLGDRLRKARAHRGHKLAALAERFDCEVSTLSNIERNVTRNPRFRLKQKIEMYIAETPEAQ